MKREPLKVFFKMFSDSLNMKPTEFPFSGLIKHFIEGELLDQTPPLAGSLNIF